MTTNNHLPMIGKKRNGVGGRDCPCCGDAPGRDRKVARRASKRADRRAWMADANDIAAARIPMHDAPAITGGWLAVEV